MYCPGARCLDILLHRHTHTLILFKGGFKKRPYKVAFSPLPLPSLRFSYDMSSVDADPFSFSDVPTASPNISSPSPMIVLALTAALLLLMGFLVGLWLWYRLRNRAIPQPVTNFEQDNFFPSSMRPDSSVASHSANAGSNTISLDCLACIFFFVRANL
jgi:hypothetical protein